MFDPGAWPGDVSPGSTGRVVGVELSFLKEAEILSTRFFRKIINNKGYNKSTGVLPDTAKTGPGGGQYTSILLKALIYLVFFSILHFAYDLAGWTFLKPFSGIDESVFQHLKMAFWAYLLASLVEYPFFKKKRKSYESFWYPRFFAATVVPWTIFLVYFLGPAVAGKFQASYLELTWAILVSYFSGLAGGLIEGHLEQQRLTFCFKAVIIFLALVSAILYITFTYSLPWLDMFRAPE